MTLDKYQEEARRTAPRSIEAYPEVVRDAWVALLSSGAAQTRQAANEILKIHDVLIWGLGLAGEAGEVADLLKKVHGHGKPFDGEKLKKELGDVLWYLANLADAHGWTLSEVAQGNIDKLRARHPNGFSVASAAAKADEHQPDCRDFGCTAQHIHPGTPADPHPLCTENGCVKRGSHPGEPHVDKTGGAWRNEDPPRGFVKTDNTGCGCARVTKTFNGEQRIRVKRCGSHGACEYWEDIQTEVATDPGVKP